MRRPLLASSFILKSGGESSATHDGMETGGGFGRFQSRWSKVLGLQRLEKPVELKTVAPSRRDVLYEIVATAETLRSIPIVHGSWVELRTERLGTKCLAKILSVDETDEDLQHTTSSTEGTDSKEISEKTRLVDGVVYVAPSLCFRLGINRVHASDKPLYLPSCVRIQRWTPPSPASTSRLSSSKLSKRLSLGSGSDQLIPCARSVQLARVASPNSSGYKSYSHTLQLFFTKTRVLSEGQVFGVPLCTSAYTSKESWLSTSKSSRSAATSDNHTGTLLEDELEEFPMQSPVEASSERVALIFFKVTNVDPPLRYFQVDPKSTTMVQEGVAQSRVPFDVEYYLHRSIAPPRVPAPLVQHHKKLTSLLLPFLHPKSRRSAKRSSKTHSQSNLTCRVLITGSRRSLKQVLVCSVARHLGVHLVDCNMFSILTPSERQTTRNLVSCLREAVKCKPAVVHLRRINAIAEHAQANQQQEGQLLASLVRDLAKNLKEGEANDQGRRYPVLLVASCESAKQLPVKLQSVFTHQINITPPDTSTRDAMFRSSLTRSCGSSNAKTIASSMAAKTAGISAGEIYHIVGMAEMIRSRDHFQSNRTENHPAQESNPHSNHNDAKSLNGSSSSQSEQDENDMIPHLHSALTEFQDRTSAGAGLAKVPNVRWSDIGGLEHVKREILDTIQLPMQHPELFAQGLKQRSGILLYGPPGTGKTLIAKAVATECSLNFISVKGPELLNMYIGESEKNVRDVFERARNAKPCVLFFDEMDSVAPKRGQGSDSGGVMDRVVSQLLTELDGVNDSADVFVIGATNRPDLVDTALTRPGRLDRLVYLGVSSTREAQLKIVQALTRKFLLAKDVDLTEVIEKCSFNFTGADFYAMCSDAMLHALKRKIAEVDQVVKNRKKDGEDEKVSARSVLDSMDSEQLHVRVCMEDFEVARKRLTPSLSKEELDHYRQLQRQYELNKKR